MAVIDLTLNRLKLPGLANYTPPFGTKKAEDVALTTLEGCNNFTLPYELERPVVVSENSSCTGLVEHNALIDIDTANVTLTLANGAFKGCKLEIIGTFSSGISNILYNGINFPIEPDSTRQLIWNGDTWCNKNKAEIGSLDGYYGTSDPASLDWLVLDGRDTTGTPIELETVYPKLYKFLGNSNTLPDLRGEFLRGAGTNSHSGAGNGGTVGQHQGATQVPYFWPIGGVSDQLLRSVVNLDLANQYGEMQPQDVDSIINGNRDSILVSQSAMTGVWSGQKRGFMTSRPTNTSVNWIICAR